MAQPGSASRLGRDGRWKCGAQKLSLVFVVKHKVSKNDEVNTGTHHIGFGWWRSPVAHLHGVQVVAGSNPVHPTSSKGNH